MAQYRTGTITLTNGSAVVTGAGTAWLANVKPGNWLWVGYGIPMARVATVDSDTQLTLETPWPSIAYVGVSYSIIRDFEPKTGAPLLAHGDPGANDVFNRAITAIAGTMNAKTIDNISPLDYGAVADGITDSGAALALALAAAAGGTLTVRGNYLVSADLTVPANTTVSGGGTITFSGGHALILSDGAIWDGPGVTAPGATAAITVGGNGVSLRNCTVTAASGSCVTASGRSNLVVCGVTLTGAAVHGLFGAGLTHIDIDGCTVTNCSQQGIVFFGNCKDISITRTRVSGIGTGADSAGIKAYGDVGGGRGTAPCSQIRIVDCIVDSSGYIGIELWGGITDVTIAGTVVTGTHANNGFGISLDTVTRAALVGNVINAGPSGLANGIELAYAEQIAILGGTIDGAQNGLVLDGTPGSADVTVASLLVNGATNRAVYTINAQRVDISALVATNHSNGICVSVQDSTDVRLRGSRLETTSSVSAAFIGADHASITVDDVYFRHISGDIPTYAVQAANGGVVTLGHITANGFFLGTQAVDTASDIRSLAGDSGVASYGTSVPLSSTAQAHPINPSIGGVGGCTRTFNDSAGVRTLRFKIRKTSGGQAPITHTIRWAGRWDDMSRGGFVTLSFGSYGTNTMNPVLNALGSGVTYTLAATDTDGYPFWDVQLPINAQMTAVVDSIGLGVVVDKWDIYRINDATSAGAKYSTLTGSGAVVLANSPTLATPTATTYVSVDGAPGNYRYIAFKSSGVTRFAFGIDYQAESGGNVGSHIFMHRCADDGSFIENTLDVDRSTGVFNFTHTPTAPTVGADANNTQLATTAYVLGQASAVTPTMAGTASTGGSTRWARGDHVHPTDTSRAPVANPTFTGSLTSNGVVHAEAGIQRGTQAYWMQTDGAGRQHWYWNTSGGTSPTTVVANEDVADLMISVTNGGSGGCFLFRTADTHTAAAGTAFTFTTVLYADLNNFQFRGHPIAYDSMPGAFTFGGALAVNGTLTAASPAFTGTPTVTPTSNDTGLVIKTVGGAYDGVYLGTNGVRGSLTIYNSGVSAFNVNGASGNVTAGGTVTATGAVVANGGARVNSSAGTSPSISGVAPQFSVNEGSGVAFSLVRSTADSSGVNLVLQKTRGTSYNSVTTVNSGDGLGYIVFAGADGSAIIPSAQIAAVVDGAPSTGSVPTSLAFATGASGRGTTRMTIASGGAITANGVTAFDANGIVGLRSYTVATLPTASPAGRMIYVSDGTSNKRQAVSDGSNWRWPDGTVVS